MFRPDIPQAPIISPESLSRVNSRKALEESARLRRLAICCALCRRACRSSQDQLWIGHRASNEFGRSAALFKILDAPLRLHEGGSAELHPAVLAALRSLCSLPSSRGSLVPAFCVTVASSAHVATARMMTNKPTVLSALATVSLLHTVTNTDALLIIFTRHPRVPVNLRYTCRHSPSPRLAKALGLHVNKDDTLHRSRYLQ